MKLLNTSNNNPLAILVSEFPNAKTKSSVVMTIFILYKQLFIV